MYVPTYLGHLIVDFVSIISVTCFVSNDILNGRRKDVFKNSHIVKITLQRLKR